MASQISGVITVTTAGTAVRGPDIGGTFLIKPDPGNTGTYCYIGNDGAGDVASTTGFKLSKNEGAVVIVVQSLYDVWFDSDTNGDKLTWLKIESTSGGVVV